ncbi:Bax inhibitor-like protein, partial [Globisporangium splendens]
MLYSANLYGGLVVFCGYVVFDTQMIIEKASMGDKDSLRHALELFLDFVSIFVRIMVILIQNADKKKRAESSSKNRR